MPEIVAAVAAVFESIGFSSAWASWSATFVVNATAAYAISTVFAPDNRLGFTAEARGRTQTVRSAVQSRNIIYGEAVTSGPLIFAATSDRTDITPIKQNGFLHLVVALASHEVEEIGDIWLNDRPLGLNGNAEGYSEDAYYSRTWNDSATEQFTLQPNVGFVTISNASGVVTSVIEGVRYDDSGPLAFTQNGATVTFAPVDWQRTVTVHYDVQKRGSFVRVKKHRGHVDQAADADLMAECPSAWTAAHRLRGIAYVYVRLEYNTAVFDTGIPNIKAFVKGKKVYDPRTGLTGYSNNWALCVYDYLRAPEGLACEVDDVDVSTVIAAANISDEAVPIRAGANAVVAQPRYVCNGVLLLDHTPDDNLRQLSSAGGGPVPILAGGVFRVHAGAYTTPTITLTESDLRGPIKVRPRASRRNLFNAVKGVCVEGYGTWQPTDFPMVRNALYRTQDGEEIIQDIELPFTINKTMAQRLAKITLERARQGITVDFPAKLPAFQLLAWDTVQLTIAKFGWTNKVFRVTSWAFNSDYGVDLTLSEESPSAYSWNFGEETTVDDAPDTNLPQLGPVPLVQGLWLDSGTAQLLRAGDGTVLSRIKVMWNPPVDVLYREGSHIDIEYKRADALEWSSAGRFAAENGAAFITAVEDRIYYFVRVRLVSRRGALGDWTTSAAHLVLGKTAPPSNVPWFLIDGDVLYWGEVTDIDLAGYRIKFHYGTNRNWTDATPIHSGLLTQSPFTPEAKPQGQITLMIKAVDQSGNESADAAYISNAFGDVLVANVVEEFDFKAMGYAQTFFDEIT